MFHPCQGTHQRPKASHIMHLSMLSCWGKRPGIGGGFELRSVFLFKCPAPGKSSWVKKVQIPHPRGTWSLERSATCSRASTSTNSCHSSSNCWTKISSSISILNAYEFKQAYTSCTKKTHEYSNICKKYAPEHNRNKSSSIGLHLNLVKKIRWPLCYKI